MRGTPIKGAVMCQHLRIIPAYAGNTEYSATKYPANKDHPRLCGEHTNDRLGRRESPGSSPLMRGTQDLYQALMEDPGIIPAYAGNTTSDVKEYQVIEDHPRLCGEHLAANGCR